MEKNKTLLDMKKICKSFFGVQVLFDVDIQLKAGEIHCLVGENGAGKSTLIKVLCGLYKDYTGEVIVDGKPVLMTTAQKSREAGIFAVQQHRDLVPTLNAVENVFLGNYILKKNGSIDIKAMHNKTEEYLRIFGISIDLDVPVSQLKVSEQEIIAICKATASDGKIFLIDEASAPLDNYERTILYDLLRKLRDEGKGIIYISHHLEEIFAIGDRVTVLRNGAHVCTQNTADTNRDELIYAMTGNKKLYCRSSHKLAAPGDEEVPVFQFESVCNKDVKNITFSIYKGEVIGFAGLEGSGKQQVADLMFGLSRPQSGSIKYKGKSANFSYPLKAIRNDIGYVPTERKVQGLVSCRSVAENMMLAMVNKRKRPFVGQGWVNRMTLQSVRDLSIKIASTSQLVEYLSGGNQQKVLLAKWMQTNMDVLLCVEPTEGVDVGARADIYRLLREMSSEGKTIIIFSSDIDELLTLCDRIFTMSQGWLTSEFEAECTEKIEVLTSILKKQEGGNEAV
jgi:ABC-type sugar transport system ATPase subunit